MAPRAHPVWRPPVPRPVVALALLGLAGAPLVLASCGGDHGVFTGAGDGARRISSIGWFMIVTGTVIAVGFYALLVWAVVRGGRGRRWSEDAVVLAGGVALPVVVIVVLTVLSLGALDARGGTGDLRIDVIGHQYWWEIRYPDRGVTTANEFRIPVGRRVEVTLTSDDVIHSFWLPALDGKVDMVPGHTNHLVLTAREAGLYRGQCAEYCGLQHARMAFVVQASPPAAFDRWLAGQARDAAAPRTASQQAGLEAFLTLPCASCHTIRGTGAGGTAGPDLTHLASRSTLAAGVIPNERGQLGGWIANSQTIKPGNLMPPIPMDPSQLQGLLDYLQSLR